MAPTWVDSPTAGVRQTDADVVHATFCRGDFIARACLGISRGARVCELGPASRVTLDGRTSPLSARHGVVGAAGRGDARLGLAASAVHPSTRLSRPAGGGTAV